MTPRTACRTLGNGSLRIALDAPRLPLNSLPLGAPLRSLQSGVEQHKDSTKVECDSLHAPIIACQPVPPIAPPIQPPRAPEESFSDRLHLLPRLALSWRPKNLRRFVGVTGVASCARSSDLSTSIKTLRSQTLHGRWTTTCGSWSKPSNLRQPAPSATSAPGLGLPLQYL